MRKSDDRPIAGLYIHIPFCRQACTYCDFHFTTNLRGLPPLMEALGQEARLRSPDWERYSFRTLYLGGGTPSVIHPEMLYSLFRSLREDYDLSSLEEVTLEANPDDINPRILRDWQEAGINRLSIGVQSLFDDELGYFNRNHNAHQAKESVSMAREAGFSNFSVDFIYGSPLQSLERWTQTLEWVGGNKIPHLSAYALTVEKRTRLSRDINAGTTPAPDDAFQAECFLHLNDWASRYGYEHYEVSNLAKRGMRSRHNSSYWGGVPYLGIGPSAHSYVGQVRRANISSNTEYIRKLNDGLPFWDDEILSDKECWNEFVLLGLRQKEGIALNLAKVLGGEAGVAIIKTVGIRLQSEGYASMDDQSLRLTPEGWLRSDAIALELFKE